MVKLLSIEWLKIKKYKTFWIIIFSFLLLLLFSIQLLKYGTGSKNFDILLFQKSFTFPYIWNFVSYVGSYFVYILACLIIILITNEYLFKTQRQYIIDGLTKNEFLLGKVYLVLSFTLIATIWIFIIGLIFGLIEGGGHNPFDSIYQLLYFFIYTLNQLGFAFMLAFLLKRSGLAIGIYFLYIMLIEFLISRILDKFVYKGAGSFLPLESSDNLLPVPLSDIGRQVTQLHQGYTNESYIVVSIIYILSYYFIIRSYLLKIDW
jgi:ABC-2 type transport system permease protein